MAAPARARARGTPLDVAVARVAMLNPLRSEEEAFRALLYAIAAIGAIVAVVFIVRALT